MIFSQVSVTYTEGRYLKLKTIDYKETMSCPRCRCTVPFEETQEACTQCTLLSDSEIPEYINEKVIVETIAHKKLQYSKAVTFSATRENGQKLFTETIFEKSILYPSIKDLEEGCEINITGFNEEGSIELLSIDSNPLH